ncbi:MAG: molybdopterin-binding protein [Thaumarchaeota archaeon]|nr:molybdopterin-binding protein [Nitrososphaerota archaeon]
MRTVEIMSIGNELLGGRTLDTNSNWLVKRLTSLSFTANKIVTVRDELGQIRRELRIILADAADLIVTVGGLGPTPGDITLSAVGQELRLRISKDDLALEMVRSRYREEYEAGNVESARVNQPRMKMACIPEGSIPLFNPVGIAPGVLLKYKRKMLLSLPGVPLEMMTLFESFARAYLASKKESPRTFSREIVINWEDESSIATFMKGLMLRDKSISIKTYPIGFGQKRLSVNISVNNEDQKISMKKIDILINRIHKYVDQRSTT